MASKGKFHYVCEYKDYEVWADTEEALRELKFIHWADVVGTDSHSK